MAPDVKSQDPAAEAAAKAPEPPPGSRFNVFDLGQRIALPVAWVVVIAVFGVLEPDTFLTSANFSTILGSQAVLVVLALGLVIPLRTGDYDLSVAATLTLTSMIIAILNVNEHWAIVPAIFVAFCAALVIGCVNGLFVVKLGVDSLITTLGTGTFIQGLVLWISNSNTIGGVSPDLVNAVILTKLFGVPLEFYYALALCVVLWWFFEHMPAGRRMLFVGRSREVSRLSGLHVDRLRWGGFVGAALVAALAGTLYAGTSGGADPTSGLSFLLPAFAAAFLGGTTILPGRFNAWGTIIAAYFLITGITGLQLLGVASFVQQLFYGGALVIAVALSEWARRRRSSGSA
ncbi:MAG TPA: ABC transporter permease [Solirubrobacterales bacterium]|jgi:ribose transport system permease protein